MIQGRGSMVTKGDKTRTTLRGRHKITGTLGQDGTTARGRHKIRGTLKVAIAGHYSTRGHSAREGVDTEGRNRTVDIQDWYMTLLQEHVIKEWLQRQVDWGEGTGG